MAIERNGTVKTNLPAPLTGYNEAMDDQSTQAPSMTVGEYLGLNTSQVQKGIFY